MLIEHLPRWIKASVSEHFIANKSSYDLYIEGHVRLKDPQTGFELRINGPDIKEYSKGYNKVSLEINVLIRTLRDSKDQYSHEKAVGIVVKAFTNTITIYKYGNGVDDDSTMLGCIALQVNPGIKVTNFGLVQPQSNLEFTTVEALYEMTLT